MTEAKASLIRAILLSIAVACLAVGLVQDRKAISDLQARVEALESQSHD
jgi:hypothetical protein